MIVPCSFTGEKLYQWMKVLVDANIKQTFPFFSEANKIFSLKLDPTPKMPGRGRIVFPSSIGENIPKWEVLQSVLLKDHFYDKNHLILKSLQFLAMNLFFLFFLLP